MNWKSFFIGVFGILLLIIIGAFFYFLGKGQLNLGSLSLRKERAFQTTQPTPTPEVRETPAPTETITAGGAVSFPEYQVSFPASWEASRIHDEKADTDILTLTLGGYEIRIYQAATGGALCLYPGSTPFEGPSATYSYFVEIILEDTTLLRRSGDLGDTAYTVCQKQADDTFIQPTGFGHISFKLPVGFNEAVLLQMDTIIASLEKI